jgi:predicted dehydrogenase
VSKLRLGVIGAGWWTIASHLPLLAEHRDVVEFVAVSRNGADLLEKIRSDWGFAISSEDYRDVVAAGIDLCVVASPAALHHEHAKAALESGAHVLLEKPVAILPDDAWDLVRTAERMSRHLVIGFGWNYHPLARSAKRLIDEGIGEIEFVSLRMSSPVRELLLGQGFLLQPEAVVVPDAGTWSDPALSGGGFGQGQLSHALGLSLWLSDLRGEEVFALMTSPAEARVELYDAMTVRFGNGAIGTIAGGAAHLTRDDNRHEMDVYIIGAGGQLHVDFGRSYLRCSRATEDGEWREAAVDETAPREGEVRTPLAVLIDLALGRDVVNCSSGELGARTVEILEAAYRSADSGLLAGVRLPSSTNGGRE